MKYQFKPSLSTPIHNQHSENEPFFSHENNANKSNDIQKTNNTFFSKSPKKPFFNKMSQPHGVSSIQKKAETHHNPSQQKHNSMKAHNKTGLPDNLKSGVENLSGYSMDDVKVHYNSDKPAQVNALAYAQGTDIHIAAGQEKHLPHEAWHIVQQKRGNVPATNQLKQNVKINDNPQLEHDANVMGEKAMQMPETSKATNTNAVAPQGAIQTIAEPVLQGVLINKKEVSVEDFEEADEYDELRNELDRENLFQITMTALEDRKSVV